MIGKRYWVIRRQDGTLAAGSKQPGSSPKLYKYKKIAKRFAYRDEVVAVILLEAKHWLPPAP